MVVIGQLRHGRPKLDRTVASCVGLVRVVLLNLHVYGRGWHHVIRRAVAWVVVQVILVMMLGAYCRLGDSDRWG